MEKEIIHFFHQKGFQEALLSPVSMLPEEIRAQIPSQYHKSSSLLVFINAGPTLWDHHLNHETPNPFDDYCLNSILELAQKINISIPLVLYPNQNETFFPLLKLTEFLNFSSPTPLGLHISLKYGMWFGIRGCVIIENKILMNISKKHNSPCLSCESKPCLNQKENFIDARLSCPYKLTEARYSNKQMLHHRESLIYLK